MNIGLFTALSTEQINSLTGGLSNLKIKVAWALGVGGIVIPKLLAEFTLEKQAMDSYVTMPELPLAMLERPVAFSPATLLAAMNGNSNADSALAYIIGEPYTPRMLVNFIVSEEKKAACGYAGKFHLRIIGTTYSAKSPRALVAPVSQENKT